jgi:hypothetical protein
MKSKGEVLRATCVTLAALALSACGSHHPSGTGNPPASQTGFDPPPPATGFTRLVAPTIPGIAPGDDVMYCQYVHAPFDRDMDILKVDGYQSTGGHHVVAFATNVNVPIGTSRLCQGDDNLATTFLGAVGGEAGAGTALPPGVALRLAKGNAIMLNTHFLNPGNKTLDGQAVLDIKFAEVDPNRQIAGFFVNVDLGFTLPANTMTQADTECTFQRDLQFFSFANHMHDYGRDALTELTRVSGAVETVRVDPTWSYEMQFNAQFTKWDLASPYVIAKGDKLHTHCEWFNRSASDVTFPREMCIGVGFYLSDGLPAPTCINGAWQEGGRGGGDAGGPAISGPPCAAAGDPGNDVGVGKYCTNQGHECSGGASMCLADYTMGAFGDFCTKLCSQDADCGTGATCNGSGTSPKICFPSACAPKPDAGP